MSRKPHRPISSRIDPADMPAAWSETPAVWDALFDAPPPQPQQAEVSDEEDEDEAALLSGEPMVFGPVEASDGQQRLDKWLAMAAPDMSRSRLKSLIEQGHVTIDRALIQDARHAVKPGQRITVCLPAAAPADPEPQNIPLTVVYEDQHLIVIDKPAGMVVHPAAGSPDGTVVNALLHHCGSSLSGIGGVRRPGIVHRIDKDTSGLLVVAKTDQAHHGLAEQFAAHTLERAYWAVVWGRPSPLQGEITGAIGRSPHNRQKMAIVQRGGKHALTRYRTIASYLDGAASLVECRLATGRTHQIRVHMTHLGHPLIGDPVYGQQSKRRKGLTDEAATCVSGFSRQALHAWLLGFIHPATGEAIRFTSAVPNDMARLVRSLGGELPQTP